METTDFIFGTQPVLEALKAGKEVEKILLQRDVKANVVFDIVQLAKDLKIPIISHVPGEKLNRVTRKKPSRSDCIYVFYQLFLLG